jgi:hypothetical protein
MSLVRPPISSADLLRAFHHINPDTEYKKRAIATMLGFEWKSPAPHDEAARTIASPAFTNGGKADEPARPAAPTPAPPEDPPRQEGLNIRISGPRRVPRPRLDWLNTGIALQVSPIKQAHTPAPLFRPQWTRAILASSLSVRRPIGPPDLHRAVEAIARGEALQMLPRQLLMTLAHGVQAIFDVGESMQPFAQDRAVLRRDLRRIIGDGNLDMLQCAGSPSRTWRDDNSHDWGTYETRYAPQRNMCVLIVSDFGIGGAPGVARGSNPYTWAILARRLAHRGHRVVGFVPYPPKRWPGYLSRALNLVAWDRSTTVRRLSLATRGMLPE